MKIILFLCLITCGGFSSGSYAQQTGDTSFHPKFEKPLYAAASGPRVLFDEAHNNFHTVDGRYAPFVRVLRADGFKVAANETHFSEKSLESCEILIVANALDASNTQSWVLPTPSAFSANEIKEVAEWVRKGGSLFLIADHMPFGGAASDLAAAFGFQFKNGFAMQPSGVADLFTLENNRLLDDSLTYELKQIQTFTGQGFACPPEARKLIVLDSAFTMYLPETAWDFEHNCKVEPAAGLTQLAVLRFGKGKVVVSAEAAMFSAQVAGKQLIGLTAPEAVDNLELLRRLVFWLSQSE